MTDEERATPHTEQRHSQSRRALRNGQHVQLRRLLERLLVAERREKEREKVSERGEKRGEDTRDTTRRDTCDWRL